jgi:hypothetical protein
MPDDEEPASNDEVKQDVKGLLITRDIDTRISLDWDIPIVKVEIKRRPRNQGGRAKRQQEIIMKKKTQTRIMLQK